MKVVYAVLFLRRLTVSFLRRLTVYAVSFLVSLLHSILQIYHDEI